MEEREEGSTHQTPSSRDVFATLKEASIQHGSREALLFCFGRLASCADELKRLEDQIEQMDTAAVEKAGSSLTFADNRPQ